MPTKFFTNRKGDTLAKKFEGVLDHMRDLHNFEAIIGYFRSSGYFRLRPFLNDIPEIKILVGINVDKIIHKAHNTGIEYIGKADDVKEIFLEETIKDIKEAVYRKEVEDGIIQLIDDITIGKVKIRAWKTEASSDTRTNLHAKVYIFTQEEEHTHAGWGTVITGSSNLSFSGLEKNFEFNVELRDYDDVKFSKDLFEDLWENESVDILPVDLKPLFKKTHLNQDLTPFELYIKMLITYFGKSIDYDPSIMDDMPIKYNRLAYQADAVNAGYNMLMQHHGFILADVVGLGKTVIATMIAKKYIQKNGHHTKILIVHPPALANNWKSTFKDFKLTNYTHYITNGSLHKILDSNNRDYHNPEDYDVVIVDESHKFRSDTSQMYALLQLICKTPRKSLGNDDSRRKRIMLLSATPLNNRPDDIANQIYLFQDSRNSTVEGVLNLQSFFAPLIKRFKELDKTDTEFIEKVRNIYEPIKNRVLNQVVIRRTRSDIKANERWMGDMEEQGVSFPEINEPKPIEYLFNKQLQTLFYETVELLVQPNSGIEFYRYRAIEYLKEEYLHLYDNAKLISQQLAVMMRTLLVKRLESSFEAFRSSLNNFKKSNQNMIDMFESEKVFIAPDLNVNKYIEDGREDELEEIIAELNKEAPNNNVFKPSDFEKGFLEGLKKDNEILENLVKRWKEIDYDPKIEKFLEAVENELMDEKNVEKKLVVFTESTVTAEYVKEKLFEANYINTLAISSRNQKGLFNTIRKNFDPSHSQPEDKTNIIVTTDVLAEGINLHRANVVVNYDVPWNSSRLMQRIGRVNRLGTKADNIYIYNFFPTGESDAEIKLNTTAISKLQGFHTAFSEDSKIYSTLEELEENVLGNIENAASTRDLRLDYLEFIRKFKTEFPKDFNRIKKLPLKSRTCRDSKKVDGLDNIHKVNEAGIENSTIAYIRNLDRDAFYFSNGEKVQELTFLEAVQIFEVKAEIAKKEKGVKMISEHHQQIDDILKNFRKTVIFENDETLNEEDLSVQEKNALSLLKDFRRALNNEKEKHEKILLEIETAEKIIKMGIFKKFRNELARYRRELKKQKGTKPETAAKKLQDIFDNYPIRQIRRMEDLRMEEDKLAKLKASSSKPLIILSESFA